MAYSSGNLEMHGVKRNGEASVAIVADTLTVAKGHLEPENATCAVKEKSLEQGDESWIKKVFAVKRSRQVVAISVAIALLIITTLLYRLDLFVQFTKGALVKAQFLIILLFVNFTALNWRCPSCRKHLGSDIGRQSCRRCGARLR
jgi:hypothetical protein